MQVGAGDVTARPFVLVNSNVVRPPVSPVGLEYVGHALAQHGIPVEVIDLAFEPDWRKALAAVGRLDPLAVGVSVRNTDDCCLATGRSFLPWTREVVAGVRANTPAPVVLGGVGFSTCPRSIVEFAGADFGVYGDGEESAVRLASALAQGSDVTGVPNLVYREGGRLHRNRRRDVDTRRFPPAARRLVDNPRYQREGAMVGVETKRGCPKRCIYCADPVAKGRTSRLRPPEQVAAEMEDLLEQGVCWYHLCDAEFNIPLEHAKDVCRALIERGLGRRIMWYTYCSPVPFDRELAGLMARSGCQGANFGVDSLDDGQLARLGREHRARDVEGLVSFLRGAGLNFMFDLLLGGPGETEETVRTSVQQAQRMEVPLLGAAVGVRVYPGTALAGAVRHTPLRQGLRGDGAVQPLFYVSPALGDDPTSLVQRAVSGDRRFMLLTRPDEQDSYNYAGDDHLARLIAGGARGAYWDILRRERDLLRGGQARVP